jgi:mRNA interferase MazF
MPTATGTPHRQGEVVLAEFPFSNMTNVKRRPALILSNAMLNQASADVIACAITSNLANTPNSVPVSTADFVSGRLDLPSLVKADHIFSLAKSRILRRLGQVKPEIVTRTKTVLFSLL